MALPQSLPQSQSDDAWFDLVPLAMIEFDEHGRVLRGNPALSAMLGYAVPAGSSLGDCPSALQRLCGWDAPLTLLAQGPEDPPLQAQVQQVRHAAPALTLRSQIWAQAALHITQPRRFLCAIQEDTQPPPNEHPALHHNIASDADAAPLPDLGQLLHELSTILESSPAGIAYLRGETLVRCNRRFEQLVGLPAGSIAGQSLASFQGLNARIDHVVNEALTEVLAHGRFESELQIITPDAPERWLALSVQRIGGETGPLELVAVLSDITGIHAQQAQLEALGRDRDLMFSLSNVGIAFVKDGCIQSANPALSELVGESPATLVGRPLHSLYAGELDLGATANLMAPLQGQGHWQGERLLLRHGDLPPLWVEMTLRLVHPQRLQDGLIVSFVNVDDRHRAEASRSLLADRMRAILDSVFVGIVTVNDQGIAWMNRSARRMFGGDLADFIGQPLSTVATPDLDHPFRLTDYLDDLQDGQSHTFECQVVGRDGRTFWVVGNAVVTLGDADQRHITYALLDIDRRRQAEAQSAEAQATLQRIIEMAPMAIQVLDAHTLTLVRANQAAAAFLDRDLAHAQGQPLEALFMPERAHQMRADMLAALDSAHILQREYRVTSKGNGPQVWDVNYLPLRGDGDTIDQLLVVASDATAQRAAEQARLDAAIAQREMLVREVHHRIKNNLQGVAGLLQQIAARKPEVAPAIAEVVGQVQAIAQVYGLQVGAGGPLRLRSVVEAIATSVQRTFGRPITVRVDGLRADQWHLPEAESIPIALSLNELLTNAHKHSTAPTPLHCTLQATDTAVRIDIRNTGTLPEGFSLDRVRGGVSGLGLVRALLPRRSARLTLQEDQGEVLTSIDLTPPGIKLLPLAPPTSGEATGLQTSLWPK